MSEPTAPAIAPAVVFGGFGRRLAAALLDSAVWIIGLSWALSYLPQSFYEDHPVAAGAVVLVAFSAWFNYFALCEWRFGQTIGKNALGLRVVPVDAGARLTYNAAALRNLLRLVDLPLALVGVDYLIVRGSPRRQRLGDRAARTVVLREAPPAPAGAGSAAPRQAGGPTAGQLFGEATAALEQAGLGGTASPSAAAAPAPSAAGPETESPGAVRQQLPPASWGPRTAVLGVLAALGLGLVLGLPAIIADSPSEGEDLSTAASIAVQLATVIGFLAAPLYVASREGAGLAAAARRLGVRGFRPSAFGWMALAAFAYLLLVGIYVLLVGEPEQEDIADAFGPVWVQAFLIVICASVSEELCFRGMLYGGLRQRLPAVAAALLSGVIFGALHAITGISAVPPLIVFGFVMAMLYERTGSVLPCVLLHALNNSLALTAQ